MPSPSLRGSSSFSSNSGQETNRVNAASIIQIGQSLKSGFDRVTSQGTPLANVDVNAANTSSNAAVFAPDGGGLVPPSVSLAADPTTDTWIYTWADVTNMGTAELERIGALKVTPGVCDQINAQIINGATPTATDLGNISNATNFSAWPSELAGKMVGCVNNNAAGATGTYFYQVLGVQ